MWDKLKSDFKEFSKEFKFTDIHSGSQTNTDKVWYAKAISIMWKFIFGGLLTGYLLIFIVSFDNIPTFDQLENPSYNQASLILDNKNQLLGKFYNENREFINYDSLNPTLIKTLLATEDYRFYQHSGIDFWALLRVGIKTLILGNDGSGGGSTISQQLAKLLFERPNMKNKGAVSRAILMVRVKLKEWLTAVKLEKSYTKEEIIALYLNKFDFIYEAHGIQTAAKTYFGKDQKQLALHESAMLIGMLKNPSLYNPKRSLARAEARRNVVLELVEDNGYITGDQLEKLKKLPVDITQFRRETHVDGLAPHFRAELGKWLKELFESEELLKPDGSVYNPYQDGLKIYTTIDPDYQRYAEQAAREHMISIQKSFFNVWTKADPWTSGEDEIQNKARAESLKQLIRETDRFQRLWDKYYSKIISELEEEIGKVDINDRTIARLIEEVKKPGYLKDEFKRKQINKIQYEISQRILLSKQWPKIKEQWLRFSKDLDKEMNTPVDMIVYDYQTQADKSAKMSPLDSIKFHRKHLQIGSLGVNPKTGEIKFWIGGTNFKYFKYDHVNSRRQVGSTFKPFLYSTVIAIQNISPCYEFQDIQYTIPANDKNFGLPETWSPSNADGVFTGGMYNMYKALALSKNSISVKLVMLLGSVEPIRGLLTRMGIDSSARRSDGSLVIPRWPSIVLGAAELSVMEMSGSYTAFANNGTYVKPFFVSKIEDKNGRIIYRNTLKQNEALAPTANYVMVDLLRRSGSVPTKYVEAGGKSGTTNNYADGWFMGITPSLVIGTWVGGEDPWIHFNSLTLGQGSVMAKPFLNKFLAKIEADSSLDFRQNTRFYRPPGQLGYELDCNKFKSEHATQNMDNSILPRGNTEEDEIFEDE
ncbi:MAG: transglycosylase domain-containing protein [Saprospiraceae bacterium]|nr:transglycosylase domain-containing protein [Saprospiraceae bacterium]